MPNRVVKPRRFALIVQVNGVASHQVEISPDEGSAGTHGEPVPAPSLAGFGLPTPELTDPGWRCATKSRRRCTRGV